MLKLTFDKDVNFFRKKLFNALKVETLRMTRYIQILCLSTLNHINQRNVSHIKLSKYWDIDASLRISYHSLIPTTIKLELILTIFTHKLTSNPKMSTNPAPLSMFTSVW